MNVQKFLVSGIVGGIVSCLAGYLIYGMLLKDFFAGCSALPPGVQIMRSPESMIWWSLILGCIFSGLTYSYIFNKWANINSLGGGLGAGFVIALLMTAGSDFIMYGTANLSNLQGTLADILCGAVLGALTGAAVGWMNGMGKKPAAA